MIVSFASRMLSHWVVGAARSVFTGRSVFRSGHGHVRRRARRRGRRLLRRRVGRRRCCERRRHAAPPRRTLTTHFAVMRLRPLFLALALALRRSPRPRAHSRLPAPPPRTQSDYYVPLFGATAGIAIPIGRLADDHAAGYVLGGLVEYAVAGQPYSLRGERIFQRFALKQGRTGDDMQHLLARLHDRLPPHARRRRRPSSPAASRYTAPPARARGRASTSAPASRSRSPVSPPSPRRGCTSCWPTAARC